MTDAQRNQILRMRYAGKDYKTVATELGLSVGGVKVYCSRHHLTDKEVQGKRVTESTGVCPCCGTEIVQRQKVKPRRFCSDKCRYAWWAMNDEVKKKKALYRITCRGCGKEFISYGNRERKYCSHECYIAARFNKQKGTYDGAAI